MVFLGSNYYIISIISHRQYKFKSLKQYYFVKPYICWCVQSHPEDRGNFEQGSTENISECNNQLELSLYNMWCSYMVLTNPHMKPRIELIIMKIFMKIVKICPKSPRFMVINVKWSGRWLPCGSYGLMWQYVAVTVNCHLVYSQLVYYPFRLIAQPRFSGLGT